MRRSTGTSSVGTRIVAVGLLTFVAWCALFITGETLDDPGGWAGVGYVAIWMVPMLGLSALVVWRPRTAVPVLTVLTLAVAAVLILGGIRSWGLARLEDRRGPIRAIAMVALAGPLGVLGWARPMNAGRLLSALGAAALVSTAVAARSAPLMIFGVPMLVAGVLLWALAPDPEPGSAAPDASDRRHHVVTRTTRRRTG